MATNRYGLDAAYFKKKLKLVARDAENYSPDDMFHELSRLMMVAANQAHLQVEVNIKYSEPPKGE